MSQEHDYTTVLEQDIVPLNKQASRRSLTRIVKQRVHMPLTSDAPVVLEIEHMVLEANKSRRWNDLKETHACQQERDRRADRDR